MAHHTRNINLSTGKPNNVIGVTVKFTLELLGKTFNAEMTFRMLFGNL